MPADNEPERRPAAEGLLDVGLVVSGLAVSWLLSVALGGAGHIAPHWFYLPIMWAGFRFGRRGAALAAAAAVVIAGPLLPADTDTWTPQAASDWVSRGLFFVGIGLVIAQLFVRLRRAGSSELHAAELRVRLAGQARFQVLVQTSSDVLTVLDDDGAVVSRDGPVTAVFGPAADRLAGSRLDELLHPQDQIRLRETLARLRAGTGGSETLLCRVTDGAGGWRHVESTIRDLRAEPAVAGFVLTSRDVTERTSLERQPAHQAHHDALTGLPNRLLLADRFTRALSPAALASGPAGLLLIDLDRFKDVNDTLGHGCGDQLLIQVADRLVGAVRGTDTVARLGGDEFAVLLPQITGMSGAVAAAEAVRAALRRPFRLGEVELAVEASIGVVSSELDGTDSSVLLQHADIAMYAAKRNSGTAGTFHTADSTTTTGDLALLGQLRRALDNGDELLLHYQPKIDLADGRLCGVEALLRWQHPQRGLLLPAEFLPAAERTGLITLLTRYVLDAALTQARQWLDAGQPLAVSVNLAARNLLHDSLAGQVAGLLAGHAVPAELLQLEVTERAIMLEPERARQRLTELATLGVQIAIDDFGAGFTALGHLKDLPVSQLKVGRGIIATMEQDAGSALLVQHIVDLGHHLGLLTVAGGVETAAAADALRRYGCDAAQGFYLGGPVPAAALDRWRNTTDSTNAPPRPDGVLLPHR